MIPKAHIPFKNATPLDMRVSPESMGNYTYSKITNAFYLAYRHSPAFYGFLTDPFRSALKCYQDLLVLSFIETNLPEGSKLLDVGGGYSRVLRHLKNYYECWCIDKYEGLGNGSNITPKDMGYRIVLDYMGHFNPELPENYFDLVFSISALEHCPLEGINPSLIKEDINRVLGDDGFSLHCLDIVIDKTRKTGVNLPQNDLYFVQQDYFQAALFPFPAIETILSDHDLFVLPENIFNQWHLPVSYEDVCIIDGCAFWKKQ